MAHRAKPQKPHVPPPEATHERTLSCFFQCPSGKSAYVRGAGKSYHGVHGGPRRRTDGNHARVTVFSFSVRLRGPPWSSVNSVVNPLLLSAPPDFVDGHSETQRVPCFTRLFVGTDGSLFAPCRWKDKAMTPQRHKEALARSKKASLCLCVFVVSFPLAAAHEQALGHARISQSRWFPRPLGGKTAF